MSGPSPDVPPEVARMLEERAARRAAGDFAAADALRERIRAAGYEVRDDPGGSRPVAVGRVRARRWGEGRSALDLPADADATVQWLCHAWPEDVVRGIASFDRFHPGRTIQHVVVADPVRPAPRGWWPHVEVLDVDEEVGWAASRNAGIARSRGRLVLVADGSFEATGDVLGPLERALQDPAVGLAGPVGLVTPDLQTFSESDGPDVDAVAGYLMAFRRDDWRLVGGFDPAFRFYRMADVDWSFRVKGVGLRVVRVEVPAVLHEHRSWEAVPAEERDRRSRKNFNRFLERFRGRFDLTVAGGPSPGEPPV